MSEDPGQTPRRGLTAVIRDEIGVNTRVRLGAVIAIGSGVVGFTFWLTSVSLSAAGANTKIEEMKTQNMRAVEEIKAQRKEDRDDVRREMERINKKLDELLARKS